MILRNHSVKRSDSFDVVRFGIAFRDANFVVMDVYIMVQTGLFIPKSMSKAHLVIPIDTTSLDSYTIQTEFWLYTLVINDVLT